MLTRAAMAQQASGTVVGAAGGLQPGQPYGYPDEFGSLSPSPGRRRPSGLDALGLVTLKLLENLLTNRYKDNKDSDDGPNCKLFPYSEKNQECKGGKAHHIVPDRCWRSPGSRGKWTSIPPLDAVIDDTIQDLPGIGKLWKGGYYSTKMDEGKGMCICVTGEQHKAIHAMHDTAEKIIGDNAKPKFITTLKVEEELGARAVSAATGCSEATIAEKLRQYHDANSLPGDTKVRADPYGQSDLTIDNFNSIVNIRTGGVGG